MNMLLRALAHACFFVCIPVEHLHAEDQAGISFQPSAGGPSTLSIFQEIPGFRSGIAELDDNRELINLDSEWRSMVDTDIWVFFLKNHADAMLLPQFVFDILEANYDGSDVFVLSATVSLEDEVSEKLMFFAFLSELREGDLWGVGCDTAALLYSNLAGNEIDSVLDSQFKCLFSK